MFLGCSMASLTAFAFSFSALQGSISRDLAHVSLLTFTLESNAITAKVHGSGAHYKVGSKKGGGYRSFTGTSCCRAHCSGIHLEVQDAEKKAALEEKRNLAAVCLRHVLCINVQGSNVQSARLNAQYGVRARKKRKMDEEVPEPSASGTAQVSGS